VLRSLPWCARLHGGLHGGLCQREVVADG
jgi:hypothetical protein